MGEPIDRRAQKSPRRPGPSAPKSRAAFAALPRVPLSHPAFVLATLVAAASIALAVSTRIYDTDVWQHLAVGRAIWQLHSVPTRELWTWPTYGASDVNASWGFRALIWPVWKFGGVFGLFAWRWGTTLAAFALLWAAARAMGARGLSALLVLVTCALLYRQRSQVRPETLVAILLAAQLWILEVRRRGGPDRGWWLVAVAWVWANAHISYWVGFVVLGVYLADGWISARGAAAAPGRKLAQVTAAALAISLLNPWGWRALWQPFEYFLFWRHEPIIQTIGELLPVVWSVQLKTTLSLIATAWPVLMVWRWRRIGLDRAELLLLLFFTALAFSTQRFLGYYALVAAPYLARDLGDALATLRVPALARSPWARGAMVVAGCSLLSLHEATRFEYPVGLGFDWRHYPVRACDFMETHDVRGRGFNQFHLGGYMLYRFWPQMDRLPFMDIHQAGTREDRYLYAWSQKDRNAWSRLDAKYRFDYVLLARDELLGATLCDQLDGDTTWARAFLDDASALFLRRGGPLDSLAHVLAYRYDPAGQQALNSLGIACASDSAVRNRVRAELEREAAGSPWNSRAKSLLANVAMTEDRIDDARRLLEEALRINPLAPKAWERLGMISLQQGRPREALDRFAKERAKQDESADLDMNEGAAWSALGDVSRARSGYRRALRLEPSSAAALDSLAALDARSRP